MVSIQLIDRSYGRICTTSTLQDSSMHKVDFVGLVYGIRYFRRQYVLHSTWKVESPSSKPNWGSIQNTKRQLIIESQLSIH